MNIKKISIATTMLLTLSLGLAACGNKEEQNASSPSYDLKKVAFPLKKKVTLKMMNQNSTLAPKNPNNQLIFKRLEKKTGVHIDWTNYQSDFAEKRNLDISSGAIPDAIFNAAASDSDILKWAKTGTIVPVDKLIKKYMPNLSKIYKEHPEYKRMVTAPNGHIYSFPWIEELGEGKDSIHTVNDIAWINVKWLKKLGLKMPKTTDDLEKVLEAFKTKDPNGNGKQDEIPMTFINMNGNEDLKVLYAAFGGDGDNDDHITVDNNGKVNFTADDDSFRKASQYFHDLWSKGLIDKAAFEQDWNTLVAKGAKKQVGLYFTWDKTNITGDNSDYEPLPVLAGPNGKRQVTRTNNYGFDRGRMVITSANKNLELTAKWIDQLYAPMQSVQDNWGTYGDKKIQNIFEMSKNKNGEPMLKHLPLKGSAPVEVREKTSIAGPLAILDSYYNVYTTKPDDAQWRMNILKNVYRPYINHEHNYPIVFMNEADTTKLAQINADLSDYIMRMRATFIKNGVTDSSWKSYLAGLKKNGSDDYLKLKEKYYDKYQKGDE